MKKDASSTADENISMNSLNSDVYTMYNSSMRTKLTKWGNSLGIRLPKVFAVQMGMDVGNDVNIEIRDGNIIISKVSESLDDLIQRITPENLHEETDTGPPVGKEIW